MGRILTMERKGAVVFAMWLLLGAFAFFVWTGCASTPKQQWYTGQSIYNASLDVLITGRTAGYISDKDFVRIEGYRRLADASLKGMHEAVQDGNLDLFQAYLVAYRGALDRLVQEAATVDREQKRIARDKKKLNAISEEE